MIKPDKRKAICCLHNEGISIRGISRQLGLTRNTVRAIIKQNGEPPQSTRKDKIELEKPLLIELYNKCNGWVERMHEILTEEKGIDIGYSTLTRLLREMELGNCQKKRCGQVPDEPGGEMQHDTSPYRLKIGDKQIPVVASLLYYRYSRMRYLKFYRSFNRFNMKCFFHEALTFYGFSAPICIIDNTNLARLRGSGKNALIVPEMRDFAKRYQFEFACHAIGHANRKAGNERSFYTVESNFFPGRSFADLEDLNRQALQWATVRMANRPISKSGLIPARTFEYEKTYLGRLASYIEPPYLEHQRATDQYGYASFAGNFYWVPGTSRHTVEVLQYSNDLRIFYKRKLLAQYPLAPAEVKNKRFSPQGQPVPRHSPRSRRRPTVSEEKKLRNLSPQVNAYLDFVLTRHHQKGKPRHRFIRQLDSLSRKLALPLFSKAAERALKYRIADLDTFERIALLQMKEGNHQVTIPGEYIELDEEFRRRQVYIEGRDSEAVDLSVYDKLTDKESPIATKEAADTNVNG